MELQGMEKGDGENKKKEEIFHVGQIEKQNDKMKEQKERMERPRSVCYYRTPGPVSPFTPVKHFQRRESVLLY